MNIFKELKKIVDKSWKVAIIIILILIGFLFGYIIFNDKGYIKIAFEYEKGLYVDNEVFVNGIVIDKYQLKRKFETVARQITNNYKVITKDRKYYILDKGSFLLLNLYFDNIFSYVKEEFDCDEFSLLFEAFSILSTINQKKGGAISIGVLDYFYKEQNNPAGHSLNIVPLYEENEINFYIFEPQIPTAKRIRDYINSKTEWDDFQKANYLFEQSCKKFEIYFNETKSHLTDIRIDDAEF